MRIRSLRPFYFRAFGDAPTVRFADCLTIVYGGNGTGKSSLAEAIEWLLYGYTTRRRKGELFSKTEYQGTYVNKGWPGGEPPFVEADVVTHDGAVHTVRRTVVPGESQHMLVDSNSVIHVDGKPASGLEVLGLVYSPAQCPVVVQHGIQDFIHARPIERYRAVSGALGLGDLIAFKDSLERAKNQYRNNPPPDVVQARSVVQKLDPLLTGLGLKKIAKRWKSGSIDVEIDYKEILAKAQQLTGKPCDDLPQALAEVRERQVQEMGRIFDSSPYRPSPSLASLLATGQNLSHQLSEQYGKLADAGERVLRKAEVALAGARVAFWKAGLALLDPGSPTICPFCEKETLTEELVAERGRQIDDQGEYTDLKASFEQECDQYQSVAVQLSSCLQRLETRSLADADIEVLRKAFQSGQERLDSFVAKNRAVAAAHSGLVALLVPVPGLIASLKAAIADPSSVHEIAIQSADLAQRAASYYSQLAHALTDYGPAFVAFEPVLRRELSDEVTVQAYTSLIDLLTAQPSVQLAGLAKRLDDEILECQRRTDAFILKQQKAALATRGDDIQGWYSRLSPNKEVYFTGFEPGTDEVGLRAKSFDQDLNAAACLSQSQLNCLGLSVYISNITESGCPFSFILFDDPVQSMDDEHHESFLMKVLPALIEKRHLQVAVLTHLMGTADRIRNLNLDKNPTYYRNDKLTASGPQIREYVPILSELKFIAERADGEDQERLWAVDRIRVLSELVIRQEFIKVSGSEVPLSCQHATGAKLLDLLKGLQGVTMNQRQGLADTIAWADPSHHTDPGWQVPCTSNILPHIERLRNLVGQWGLGKA